LIYQGFALSFKLSAVQLSFLAFSRKFNALLIVPQRYREASDIIKKGKLCSLFINDLDAGAARDGPHQPRRSLRRDLCMGLHLL